MRADRLLSLLMLLQTRGKMSAEELSEELEISVRTVYRDIEALSYSGVPVYASGGPGGGYSLLDSWKTDLTGLTREESEALFLLSLPGPLSGLKIGRDLKNAVLKLSAAFPEGRETSEKHLKQRLHMDTVSWFRYEEETPFLNELFDAVWKDRSTVIGYMDKKGKISTREVDPYALVSKSGIWYLVCRSEKGMRVFRVSRINGVNLLENTFIREENFNLTEYWKEWCDSFKKSLTGYKALLSFSPEGQHIAARLYKGIESVFSETGAESGGWKTIPFEYNNIHEATGQIMSFGGFVRVVEPAELKEAIQIQARCILENYGAIC